VKRNGIKLFRILRKGSIQILIVHYNRNRSRGRGRLSFAKVTEGRKRTYTIQVQEVKLRSN
jgi:hypothetical protein